MYIHSRSEDLKRRTESVHDLQVTAGLIEFLLIIYMLVMGAKKW